MRQGPQDQATVFAADPLAHSDDLIESPADTQAIAGDVREVDRREEEEASEAAADREEREVFEQRCVAYRAPGQPAAACPMVDTAGRTTAGILLDR